MVLDSVLLGVALAAMTMQMGAWFSYRILGVPSNSGTGSLAVAAALVLICIRHILGGAVMQEVGGVADSQLLSDQDSDSPQRTSAESPTSRAADGAHLPAGFEERTDPAVPTWKTETGYPAHEQTSLALREQSPAQLPTITISKPLIGTIGRYIHTFLEETGADNEAGGMLVGEYKMDSDGTVVGIHISGFIPAGPNSDFSPGSIQFDNEYLEASIRLVQLTHSNVRGIGTVHRHPGSADRCSSGDLATDRKALRESKAPFLVTAIITVNNRRQDRLSLRWEDLKFDFHLLGEATGFVYEKVGVRLSDTECIEVPETMIPEAQRRGASLTLDFRALRSLPGVSGLTIQTPDVDGRAATVVRVRDEVIAGDVVMISRPGEGLECLVRIDNQPPRTLRGPWQQEAVAPLMWFTELVCAARRALRAESEKTLPLGRYHSTFWERDPRRLEIERRAMHEAFGSDVVLLQQGTTLFWKATLRESGRELGVKIVYPEAYPNKPPIIVSDKPLPPSPHSPAGGTTFCWIPYSGNGDWNPSRDTAAVALAVAYRWYASLLVYLTLGRWPKESDHSALRPQGATHTGR